MYPNAWLEIATAYVSAKLRSAPLKPCQSTIGIIIINKLARLSLVASGIETRAKIIRKVVHVKSLQTTPHLLNTQYNYSNIIACMVGSLPYCTKE